MDPIKRFADAPGLPEDDPHQLQKMVSQDGWSLYYRALARESRRPGNFRFSAKQDYTPKPNKINTPKVLLESLSTITL
jgi:hypothetical protein